MAAVLLDRHRLAGDPARNAGPNAGSGAGCCACRDTAPPRPRRPSKAPASVKATEVVDNPYGLEALWKGGDTVARIMLGILAIMSVGSWYIIITKVHEQCEDGRPGARRAEDVLDRAHRARRAPRR